MAVFMLFPMYMIYINSFKNFFQFIIDPLSLPKPWTLKNYEYAVESFNYFRLLLNNLVFESVSLFFIVLLGAMAVIRSRADRAGSNGSSIFIS